LVTLTLLVAACAGAASPTPTAPASGPHASTSPETSTPPTPAAPVHLTVGLGYIPSVQFAQFYLADAAGYYREAGLEVELLNKIDPELVTLVGQGAVDVALADGTSVVPAVAQEIPIRYAVTIYARLPNVVFAKASSGITSAADLAGRKVGTPGKFGSGWIMLQALLSGAGMTPDDVEVVLFPDFSQLACVERDECAAATGFANNEPIQLALSGAEAVVLRVDDVVPLQGNGLIVGESTLASKGDALRAFVAATLRAESEIIAAPEVGLDAAIARIPELAGDRDKQLAVLRATIEIWQSARTATAGLGALDRDGWAATISFMSELPGGLVPKPVSVDDILTDALLP
jgi:NitT/TauT family transport system substrate-binding protein